MLQQKKKEENEILSKNSKEKNQIIVIKLLEIITGKVSFFFLFVVYLFSLLE